MFNHETTCYKAILTVKMARHDIKTAAAAKSLQSCPTLCDPVDGSTPGSPVPGILQARTLEWVAISFSNAYHSQLIFYFNDNAIFLSFKEWNLPKMPNIWCIL